jgi:hypothetical protein
MRENRLHGSLRRREETRPVGAPVRPRRLPPTLPRPASRRRAPCLLNRKTANPRAAMLR